MDEALAQNIPKATLDKTLKRSKTNEELATEFIFEIRGPGRAAVVVECLAKNRGLLPVKINPIMRKHGSVEEKGILNMFDKARDKRRHCKLFNTSKNSLKTASLHLEDFKSVVAFNLI